MWQKISFKGVLIGALADIVGVNLWILIVSIYIVEKYQLLTLPSGEIATQLTAHFSQDSTVASLSIIVGFSFTAAGGYIAALVAKHDELLNGTLASFLSVLIGLHSITSTPITYVLVGVILNPLLGFIGGYLRLRQTHGGGLVDPLPHTTIVRKLQ
jgi:hypothetical protein